MRLPRTTRTAGRITAFRISAGRITALRITAAVLGAMAWHAAVPREGAAQNDWQFPDPRFGMLSSGRAPTPADDRRYRAEIAGAVRPPRRPERARPARVRPRRAAR